MLDHIGFSVTDYARSRGFYDAALAPLGVGRVMEVTKEETGGYEGAGYGVAGKPYFWIGAGAARRSLGGCMSPRRAEPGGGRRLLRRGDGVWSDR